MTFETLPGLPGMGPLPEQFSATGQGTFREGLVVRFMPDAGEPWIGNFQPGIGGASETVLHPDARQVVVVSGGQAYVVDPSTRRAEILSSGTIGHIYGVSDLRLVVLDHQGIRFEALGPEGVRWRTRRISWDGFRNVAIKHRILFGEAWNPMGDAWEPFSVDLRTGTATGGSYHYPDAYTWEKLHDVGHAS